MSNYIRLGRPKSNEVVTTTNVFESDTRKRNVRNDSPYLTQTTPAPATSNDTAATTQYHGKRYVFSTSKMERCRMGMTFGTMPADLSKLVVATLHIAFDTWFNTLETDDPAIYISNTDDHLATGTWYDNLDNYAGKGVYGLAGDQAIDLDIAGIVPRAGLKMSILVGHYLEMTGAGVASAGSTSQSTHCLNVTRADAVGSPYIELGFSA